MYLAYLVVLNHYMAGSKLQTTRRSLIHYLVLTICHVLLDTTYTLMYNRHTWSDPELHESWDKQALNQKTLKL